MSAVTKLYGDFVANFQDSPEYIIGYFTDNSIIVNNLKRFDTEKDFDDFTDLYQHYLSALNKKGRYNDALDSSLKIIPIIELSVDQLKIDRKTNKRYRAIIFLKSEAHFELRDYKVALIGFKQLSKDDPKNDNLKLWIDYSRFGTQLWLSRTLTIVAFILLFGGIFFKKFLSADLRWIMDFVGLVLIITALIIDSSVKRNRRKIKNMQK